MISGNYNKRNITWYRKIDKSWTLFLDRDGVINKRLLNNYVKSWNEFEFIPGVTDAIKLLNERFGKILIITNQQGIGKGLMSEEDLNTIHKNMIKEINSNKGYIDKIYYSPYLANEKSIYRKPGIGMALKARKEFPDISFKRTVMVGDTLNDMKFGKKLKMFTVLISQEREIVKKHPELIDLLFEKLLDFSEFIREA